MAQITFLGKPICLSAIWYLHRRRVVLINFEILLMQTKRTTKNIAWTKMGRGIQRRLCLICPSGRMHCASCWSKLTAKNRVAFSNFDFERRACHTCIFYAHTQKIIYGAVTFCCLLISFQMVRYRARVFNLLHPYLN